MREYAQLDERFEVNILHDYVIVYFWHHGEDMSHVLQGITDKFCVNFFAVDILMYHVI
jgi:hypothetical protein